MNIAEAVALASAENAEIRRSGWTDPLVSVKLNGPHKNAKLVYGEHEDTFLPSRQDWLASDWEITGEAKERIEAREEFDRLIVSLCMDGPWPGTNAIREAIDRAGLEIRKKAA